MHADPNPEPFRNRILAGHFSHASVLGLNALLAESPSSLIDNFPDETPAAICQGIANNDVSALFTKVSYALFTDLI